MSKVSVLMPMRNAERYVREAVESVLAQEGCDLELVVVDDKSTDRSRAIVEDISDPRVRRLDGPGRGVSAAWNLALANASGDVIMQCDSDDLYPPGRVAWQLDFLVRHEEFGAVCGSFSTIEPSGRELAHLFNPSWGEEEITKELLKGVTRTHLCTYAIRRRCLDMVGGKREYFESAEDIDLQFRLAEVCRVWFGVRPSYHYRLHDLSVTHNQASDRRKFYEAYARELSTQRALGKADDLARGQPREPPVSDSRPDRAAVQIQGHLIGEAWRLHKRGLKFMAIRLGLRAIAQTPTRLRTWWSVLALVLKPSGRRERVKS